MVIAHSHHFTQSPAFRALGHCPPSAPLRYAPATERPTFNSTKLVYTFTIYVENVKKMFSIYPINFMSVIIRDCEFVRNLVRR